MRGGLAMMYSIIFIPIGPFIARGDVTGAQISVVTEGTANGSLSPVEF
jgi:hypothetical protein